jgi:hypothetical protein
MIGKAGRVEMVIPPELAGETVKGLHLFRIPLSEALDTVLLPRGYEAVLEGNTYSIRKREGGPQPLLHIGARLISLPSAEFDKLIANVPPEQQTTLPGGISVVSGRLFHPAFLPLLSSNTAQILVEPHCPALSGHWVPVPISEYRERDAKVAIAPNQVQFGVSEAYVGPEITANGSLAVSLSLRTRWVRADCADSPTQLAAEIPKLPVKWGDEVWVRGWQRLVDPQAAPAGSEIVMVLSIEKQPLEE